MSVYEELPACETSEFLQEPLASNDAVITVIFIKNLMYMQMNCALKYDIKWKK